MSFCVFAMTTTTTLGGRARPLSPRMMSVVPIRGGSEMATAQEAAASAAFARGMDAAEPLIVEVEAAVATGQPYEGVLGAKCDEIFAVGLGAFADVPGASAEARSLFEEALDARLECLFVKHVSALRAKLLAGFRAGEVSIDEVDRDFKNQCESAKRTASSWSHDADRASLKAVLLELKARSDRVTSVNSKASAQQQSYMQLFQTYQAQIQQLQAAVGAAPPEASLAYRIPDTDLAIRASKQADKTTLTLTCVPDDGPGTALLGTQGFVKGITPVNFGFTLNLHV